MDIKAHLTALELSKYIEIFEDNDIDMTVLPSLSEDDLKDIGITSLGHRRKILGSISTSPNTQSNQATQTNPQNQQSGVDTTKANSEEVDFYETSIGLVNGGFADVKITSRRAILGSKTYSLQNIAAVESANNEDEIRRHRAEVDEMNEKIIQENKSVSQLRTLGFFLFLLCCVGGIANDAAIEGIVLGIIILIMFMLGKAKPLEDYTKSPIYYVRLMAAGTSTDVIVTTDKQTAEQIVESLNNAIVQLSM